MGAPSVSNARHVTECANAWSVIAFVLTSSQMALYAAYALTQDDMYSNFYAWVTKPTCFTAMAISVVLKPSRTYFGYMAFLQFQYAVMTLLSEVSEIAASRNYSVQLSPLQLSFSSILEMIGNKSRSLVLPSAV